eukprot:TRINITY_DN15056_c0_g2_i3.p2 TRINITY_DN15056_c0_g2~~TRINITY_DN15056_c0_g2_i3.p2  ORF type:complete len:106 (-),score=16.51 TRINITY_DN15056_c0_g2_i3:23-340(-)
MERTGRFSGIEALMVCFVLTLLIILTRGMIRFGRSLKWCTLRVVRHLVNVVRYAKIMYVVKVRGLFYIWIKCNPDVEYKYDRIDTPKHYYELHLESKYGTLCSHT